VRASSKTQKVGDASALPQEFDRHALRRAVAASGPAQPSWSR
jgi:hypothetical protein